MPAMLVEVRRGSVIESVHWGHVAVVDTSGTLVASSGSLDASAFMRSAAKPFQALPLVLTGAADAFGFTTEELALACSSHNGTHLHQELVLAMLNKAGASEGDLRCGFSPPLDEHERARVTIGEREPALVQCECSGKHAGMLAACRHAGWPAGDYLDEDHPLQRSIAGILASACGVPLSSLVSATDGCSLPTWSVPVGAIARAYAVLADPIRASWNGSPEQRLALLRLREAMTLHPELIAGHGETDTEIMRITGGRVVAKLGAEGLLCLAIPEAALGVAIRDISGSTRSLGPSAVAVLSELDLLSRDVLDDLERALCPPVESFAGQPVGAIRPALTLGRPPTVSSAVGFDVLGTPIVPGRVVVDALG